MSDRYALIARKQEVRQQIKRLQRELESLHRQSSANARQRSQVELQIEQLMAQEYNLRLAIDQSNRKSQ